MSDKYDAIVKYQLEQAKREAEAKAKKEADEKRAAEEKREIEKAQKQKGCCSLN